MPDGPFTCMPAHTDRRAWLDELFGGSPGTIMVLSNCGFVRNMRYELCGKIFYACNTTWDINPHGVESAFHRYRWSQKSEDIPWETREKEGQEECQEMHC